MISGAYDIDDDQDMMFTHAFNGVVLYVDDVVRISYQGEMRDAEILQISKDGKHLKVQLDSGDITDILLFHVEEKQ